MIIDAIKTTWSLLNTYSNCIFKSLLLFELLVPALVDSFSLEFKWQLVSTSRQESSQYSGQSLQCSSLHGLQSSSYFQVLKSLFLWFGVCTKSTNYNGKNYHFYVRQFFNSLARPWYLSSFWLSFNLTRWSIETTNFTNSASSLFSIVSVLKSQKCLCISFSRTDAWLCIYHLFAWSNFNFLRNSQRITCPPSPV